MLVPLEIPPGVQRNGTPLQAKPRWRDSHLVRWREGALEPQGGWQRRQKDDVSLQVTGKARAAFAWRANNGTAWLAIGTHSNLYAFENGLDITDITPTGYVPGSDGGTVSDGYGMGDYGEEPPDEVEGHAYGTPSDIDADNVNYEPATVWTLDNWGQNLIAHANSDGIIYMWPLTGLPAAVTNAPVNNASVVVTNERILMAIGADGNPRLVKWSDQEAETVWTASPLNQAGEIGLHTNGELITARTIPDGTLIWSTEDLWLGRYLGQPFIYGFEPLAGKCSLASGQAIGLIDSRVVWMGKMGFWIYDGYLKPLPSDVGDDVFSHINQAQLSKIWCLTNHDQNEAVWFYPSDNSTEIDSYVTWNWRDNYWLVGKITRLCGVSAGIFDKPILVDADGWLLNHGIGYSYSGADMPYVETWPMEIGDGERVAQVKKLISDELTLGDVEVSFKTRQYPTGPEISHGPYEMKNPLNLRLAGRQVAIKFTGVRPTQWRVGRMRLDVQPQGRR